MEHHDIIEIEDITQEIITIITIMDITIIIKMIITMDSIITTLTHGINQFCITITLYLAYYPCA